jgi:hypothetical protein
MRIERLVPYRARRLWQGLIENAELTERGAVLRLELCGGAFETAAQITRYESSRLLECSCGGTLLRWQLEPRGCETTRLIYTCTLETAQWLACLDITAQVRHEARARAAWLSTASLELEGAWQSSTHLERNQT